MLLYSQKMQLSGCVCGVSATFKSKYKYFINNTVYSRNLSETSAENIYYGKLYSLILHFILSFHWEMCL